MQKSFNGANIHIVGMARSGMAAAEVLSALGAALTLHDAKEASALTDAIDLAERLGAKICCGSAAYQGIEGADAVIRSPGVPLGSPGLAKASALGIEIIPEIELAYRISPAPIIAITGTNGKTTTTALTGEMVRRSGRNTFIAGNIVAGNIRLPLVKAAFNASPNDCIVAEISSFQLESITSFRPKVAMLLNISGDHMDRYSNIEEYALAKARIFECQTDDDFGLINADNPAAMRCASAVRSRLLTFSRSHKVCRGTFARGTEIWWADEDGERFICDTKNMKLRGVHNLENALAAAAAAVAVGVEPSAVQSAVDSFNPPEHRLEPVAEIGGVEFINNSMCTNVDASVASLAAIQRPAVVIAGGKDKGSDYTELGRAFALHAKHVVLIGVDAPVIEHAARAAGFNRISHAQSLEDAVRQAWVLAEPGDTVILSPGCASFDMFQDFEHRGRVFKSAVAELKAGVEEKG